MIARRFAPKASVATRKGRKMALTNAEAKRNASLNMLQVSITAAIEVLRAAEANLNGDRLEETERQVLDAWKLLDRALSVYV